MKNAQLLHTAQKSKKLEVLQNVQIIKAKYDPSIILVDEEIPSSPTDEYVKNLISPIAPV